MFYGNPRINNGDGVYNGGGGGGGGAFVPDGYKIYQILKMKNGNHFPQGAENLGKIIIDYDDILILDVDNRPIIPNSPAITYILRMQATNGWSQFISGGFYLFSSPAQYYYRGDNGNFGSALSYPSNEINYLVKSYTDKLIINGVTSYVTRPQPNTNKFGMVVLGTASDMSSTFTFYSFKVYNNDETELKQYWLPALEIATSNKGIIDIKSGTFVKVDVNADATLLSEIII